MQAIAELIKRRQNMLAKCISLLLTAALCLVNIPFAYAEFASDGKQTFRASVTIGGGADSDYDIMSDAWEQQYGLDPQDPDDAYDDNDNDGINNREEYRMGTNPTVSNNGITASLSASPSSGLQPLTVNLTASAAGNTFPIVKYEWDFDGNGTYDQWTYASKGNSTTYRYTADGTYNAKLRVTDSMGNAAVARQTITTQRNSALSPPTANPDLAFADIPIPATTQLDGSGSDDVGVVRYEWDTTGNGEFDTSRVRSADITKTYNETVTKSFNAALKVTDTDGLSDIAFVGINTNAAVWNDSPSRPKVYPNNYIIDNAVAGVPVGLGGFGTPKGNIEQSVAPGTYGYAKKLEWDFEGDGIYDWSSTLDNSDWTGRADITHTYGVPGIYRAVLRVQTEAALSATETVLVIVSSSSQTIPQAQAKVSYNGTNDVTEIQGIVPVKARFNHSFSSGQIAKYEWDFDGDKKIDFTTTSATEIAAHDYQYPGYCVAMLKVTDTNGLIDTFYIPVFVTYPSTYSSYIKMPDEGQVVAGNAITLSSEVFPDDAGVNEVMFQYRKEGTTAWTNIGLGAPVMSYTKTWDTTGLENGARYQVRAIVNGQDSSYFKITTLVVNNATTSPDVYEEKNGIHKKRVKVNPRKSNFVALPDGTSIYVPHGALPESGTPEVIIEEVYNVGGVANAVDISITGISKFDKDLTITIPYQDANNDGIVDGTAVNENDLILRWYNPDTLQWEPLYDSVVYPDENFLSGKTNHLTIFGIGPVVAAVAAGGGAASMGTQRNVSYCFIATAAYGTPMAKEVMALREFRDRFLIRDNIGRKFVWYYYRYSPPIARFISDKPKLKALVRFLLKPIVKIAKVMVS